MNSKERELVHCTSKLLVSLLFDTVIRFDDDGPKLPSSIARRYVLNDCQFAIVHIKV